MWHNHLWNLDFSLQGGGCERVETAIYETCIEQDSSIKMEEVLARRNNGNYEKRGRERKDKRFLISLDINSEMDTSVWHKTNLSLVIRAFLFFINVLSIC